MSLKEFESNGKIRLICKLNNDPNPNYHYTHSREDK